MSTYTVHEAKWFLAGYDTGHHVGETAGYAAGFREGYEAGLDLGRTEAVDLADAEHVAKYMAENKALVAWLVNRPSFAELCDIRGDHDRGRKARATLKRNGVIEHV